MHFRFNPFNKKFDLVNNPDDPEKANLALSNLASVAINTSLVSDTDNTDALGSAAISWSDLWLGNESVITWSSAPSTADVTLTHSANTLTLAGGNLSLGSNNLTLTGSIASTGSRVTKGWFTDLEVTNDITISGTALAATYAGITHASQHAVSGADTIFPADPGADKYLMWDDDPGVLVWADGSAGGASTALDNLASVAINTTLVSDTDNTDALGTAAISWSDLYLGNESVITWSTAPSTADVTLTHSANTLTLSGGTLALGVAGSSAGILTLSGATSGTVTLQTAAAAGTYSLTLPTSDGDANQVLTTDGSGILSWTTNSSFAWSEVTGTSQAAVINNGYICNNAGLVTVTLPDTAAVGSIVRIAGKGAGGWKLQANAGETIKFGNATTSAAGSLASTLQYDAIEVICITADTTWEVLSSVGNITVA